MCFRRMDLLWRLMAVQLQFEKDGSSKPITFWNAAQLSGDINEGFDRIHTLN